MTFRPRSPSHPLRRALAGAPARSLAAAARTAAAVALLAAAAVVPAAAQEPAVDYLWVLRNSLIRAEDVPRVVERARAMGVRGILVQVIGRGDAWYRSDRLPHPEPLAGRGRDPLGEILPLAHAAGLEVHAWINCCLVWSAPNRPRDARHVLHQHPEWVARLADGRPMTRLTPAQRRRMGVEGVFLSPAHPGVRRWIVENVRELVTRYPVDGVHLDYIRNPAIPIGYDQTTRARFALETGVDPVTITRAAARSRARLDSAWAAFQMEQVTAIVREVRDTLAAIRPGLPLSAAVIADTITAQSLKRQPWGRWVREGLIDRAYLMCYAPEVQTVLDQLATVRGQLDVDRLVPGIAVYNTSPALTAAKIKAARALGYRTVALYSYDSLFERPGRWDRLRSLLGSGEPPEGTR